MPLGAESDPNAVLPKATVEVAVRLRHFVAENARTARRMLVRLPLAVPIQQVNIAEFNEHTPEQSLPGLLAPLLAGDDVGLMSEAGCPAIADPGAALVAAAHSRDIPVMPLVGPSSILLALMASGMNAQAFAFQGYLPVEPAARAARVIELESASARDGSAQAFIETPYRNEALFAALLSSARATTRLTVATDLTLASEAISSRTIAAWKKQPAPVLAGRPTIFVLQAERALSARASKPGRRS